MEYLKNAQASPLYWIQLNFPWGKQEYELRSDEAYCTYCTLNLGAVFSGVPVTVVSADGQWTLIKDDGGETLRIESSDGATIAVCDQTKSLRIVEFSNGRRFRWDMNSGRSKGAFYDNEGTDTLLSFKVTNSMWVTLKLKVRVDLARRVKELPEASLLAALGLYFLIPQEYY